MFKIAADKWDEESETNRFVTGYNNATDFELLVEEKEYQPSQQRAVDKQAEVKEEPRKPKVPESKKVADRPPTPTTSSAKAKTTIDPLEQQMQDLTSRMSALTLPIAVKDATNEVLSRFLEQLRKDPSILQPDGSHDGGQLKSVRFNSGP